MSDINQVETQVSTEATSFWTYLKDNIPNHLKVLGIVTLIVGGVIGFNYVRDLKAQLAAQQKTTATLSQQFQALGPSAVAGNSISTDKLVTQQASDTFGTAVISLMQQQNAKITSLTLAQGMTAASVAALSQQAPTFTQAQHVDSTGVLTGYRMDETRAGGPSLSSVNLFYNPAEKDPSKAFLGTAWTHNQEVFKASTGEWVKQKDGGLATTFKLSRLVSKPDPLDPTKMVQVGVEEDIPITGANTVYTPAGLVSSVVVPRWTLGLGLSKASTVTGSTSSTSTSGVSVYGAIDYRVTSRYGAFVGTANNGLFGGVSIRLDAK